MIIRIKITDMPFGEKGADRELKIYQNNYSFFNKKDFTRITWLLFKRLFIASFDERFLHDDQIEELNNDRRIGDFKF